MIATTAPRPPVTRVRYVLERSSFVDGVWMLIGVQGAISWFVGNVRCLSVWEAELMANDITGEDLTWSRSASDGHRTDRSQSSEITEGGAA